MSIDFEKYKPSQPTQYRIEYEDDLFPVIDRISQYIPPELVWQYYASDPGETGGVISFPFTRVDMRLITSRDQMTHINKELGKKDPDKEKIKHKYELLSNHCLATLLWIEIGFGGLRNYAYTPYSISWTALKSDSAYSSTSQQRGEDISKEEGFYHKIIKDFKALRRQLGIQNDPFSQFNTEFLLDKFN